MSSVLAEVAELRDAVEKLAKLGKRIEFRDKMQRSREERATTTTSDVSHLTKGELRRYAQSSGLLGPGRVTRHE